MNVPLVQAKKIIEKIEYMNIATITPDGMPWNSPVYCSFDKDLNFYWISWKENQHSKNIAINPHVFITIYDSTVPSGTGSGVYFQGIACMLKNPKEILVGIKTLYDRSKRKMRAIEMFLKKFPRRVYRFTPEKAWTNGDGDVNGNFIDIRLELNIEDLRTRHKTI